MGDVPSQAMKTTRVLLHQSHFLQAATASCSDLVRTAADQGTGHIPAAKQGKHPVRAPSRWLPADNHLRPLQLPPLSRAASFSYGATALTDQHSSEERQWGYSSPTCERREPALGFSTHKKQKTARICTSNLNKNPKASFRVVTP